jgi:F-type H+-transporting ATPase subunit a
MASPVLHIKDAYYFEVPKPLWPSHRQDRTEFPDVWIKLDPDYQFWEAQRLHAGLAGQPGLPAWPELRDEYLQWREAHENFGKPLDVMLEERDQQTRTDFAQAVEQAESAGTTAPSFEQFVQQTSPADAWFSLRMQDDSFGEAWDGIKATAGSLEAYVTEAPAWAPEKIDAYNHALHGKVLIPQPFGQLRNLYEPESGFCISKFMVIELVVAVILLLVFGWLGRKARSGAAPKGTIWNGLEILLVYIRDNMARPAIGAHDGDHYVPLLWTLFMFVLSCNLCGLLPWVGSPTASFGVTFGLAFATFATSVICGMRRFGFLGFFGNQVPSMSLALPLALVIKPMLLVIELVGFCIKHLVLAIRLLANMVAGHLVLLGVMGLAFGAVAAAKFAVSPDWQWWVTAVISIVASTLFSCLELFVAFLQAYIFTFLSALFIGAAIHHH